MILLTGGLLLVVEIGLAVFCFADMALTPEASVQWLPRWGWALALLVFPFAGSLLWLFAARPRRQRQREGREATAQAPAPAPESESLVPSVRPGSLGSLAEDAAFVARLWEINEENERMLQRWEKDLRRREDALRQRGARADDRRLDAA